jgi:hypothetical protein
MISQRFAVRECCSQEVLHRTLGSQQRALVVPKGPNNQHTKQSLYSKFLRRYKMQDIKSREKLEKVIEKIKELEKELNAELEARKKQREYYECRMERVNR